MDSLELNQSRSKREIEEKMDGRRSRYAEGDDQESTERKKHRSSKLPRFNATDSAEQDNGRRKSLGDKDEGRKKSGCSGQDENGSEDCYDIKRESHTRTARKNAIENVEMRSKEEYHGKDLEGNHKGIDEYNDQVSMRKKSSSSSINSPENRVKIKVDSSPEGDRDFKYSDCKEISREKGRSGQNGQERTVPTRRRWDVMGSGKKTDDSSSFNDRSDLKIGKFLEVGNYRDRPSDSGTESGHPRRMIVNSKGASSSSRDGKKGDVERNRGHSDTQVGDLMEVAGMLKDDKQVKSRMRSPAYTEEMQCHRYRDRPCAEKVEKHKRQRDALHDDHDEVEIMEGSDEEVRPQMQEKIGRKSRYNQSLSPEKGRRYTKDIEDCDRGQSESDTERNTAVKGKDSFKNSRDFRPSKGKDGIWNEGILDQDISKDYWRSKQDAKAVREPDNIMVWESQSHETLLMDNEKAHFRSGYKKDNRARSEGGRFESSDSIEIKLNYNLDFATDASRFPERQGEAVSHQDSIVAPNDEEWRYPAEDKGKLGYGSSDDLMENFHDDFDSPMDQITVRSSFDSQGGKESVHKGFAISCRMGQNQIPSSPSQAPFGYQGLNSFNRISQQGLKGAKAVRGGRGRMIGRDVQRGALPMHLMGPPFSHLGLPPGAMQSMGPNMAPSVGPPLGPSVYIPPFAGPLPWPAGRGIDINMLAAPPNLPPIPSGPAGPRFAPNLVPGPNQAVYFNQQCSVRPNPILPIPELNAFASVGREVSNEKALGGWGSRIGGPSGKAPSRGEQNDYSQNFVDTGMRPQNFIRELELTSVVEDYPKLRELIQRKDEIVINSSSPPMYYKTDLREFILNQEFFGTKFDVILVDPPWEEYVHRAPGITDHIEYWTFEEIQNLKLEAIADTPSFIFLWVGDGVGLEQGRQCLKKWGFRRCEDICWVKTNKKNATPGLRHDSHTLFQHSKEHCLMGIKGTVRRSTDGHIIHANIDTDIIIAEEPPDGSTKKPDDMYRIIEHFSLGRRRLELFGGDHNIRPGWLTLGKGLSSSNFDVETYIKNFTDKDGKVWQGGSNRGNPPSDAPHLVATTPEIESLRPKSPPQKSQQPQLLPLINSSSSRRSLGGSPQNSVSSASILNHQDASPSEPVAMASPWVTSVGGVRETEGSHMGISGDNKYEGYNLNGPYAQVVGDSIEFDPNRTVTLNIM